LYVSTILTCRVYHLDDVANWGSCSICIT